MFINCSSLVWLFLGPTMEVDTVSVRKWGFLISRYIFYLLLIKGCQRCLHTLSKLLAKGGQQHLLKEVRKNKRYLALSIATISTLMCCHKQFTIAEDFLALFVAQIIVQSVGSRVTINYGVGMACSFFEGYLVHVIPSDGARFVGFQENIRIYEANERGIKFPVHKLFIVITKSLYCPTDLSLFNKRNRPDLPSLEALKSLPDVVKNVAGVRDRVYRNTAYKIARAARPPVYLVAECATPLHTLHCVLDKRFIYDELCDVDVEELVEDFCSQLQKTIDRSPNCRGKCTLVYYDDQDESLNLADVLLDKIREEVPNFEEIIRKPEKSE